MDFHTWWLKRKGHAQGCAFWSFVDNVPHLGVKFPQNPHFWGVNMCFIARDKILKVAYYQNYCIDSNQILHVDIPSSSHLRWPNKSKAAILKIVKSPYLCNRLTNLEEIWHDGACWPHTADWLLKCPVLKIQAGGSPVLKITKVVISQQRFDISSRISVWWSKMVSWLLWPLKNFNFKIPRRWTAAILKTIKSPYLGNLLADFDEI